MPILSAQRGGELVFEEVEKIVLVGPNLYENDVIDPASVNLRMARRCRSADGPQLILSATASGAMCLLAAANPFGLGNSACTGHPVNDHRKYLCAVARASSSRLAQHIATSA